MLFKDRMKQKITFRNIAKTVFEYFMVSVGCFLMAFGFNAFCTPHLLAPGGFSGIAAIIYYLTGFPVGICTFALSFPWFAVLLKQDGFKGLVKSLFGTAVFSLALDLTTGMPSPAHDVLLASIFGGVAMGAACGIIFMFNGSTGGTDLIAAVLHKKFSGISSGMWLLIIDASITAAAGVILGNIEISLYSAITVYTTMKVIDLIENGFNNTRAFYIISDRNEAIKEAIFERLERGATFINAQGAYNRDEREILMCLVKRFQVSELKSIVRKTDPDAFVFSVEVSEVFGEGFTK